MSPKRKVGMLSVAEKYDIIQMIKNGDPQNVIADKYNISYESVVLIKEHHEQITEELQRSLPSTSSSIKRPKKVPSFERFDAALRQWYIRYSNKNITITKDMLASKAMELSEKLRSTIPFKAGRTWMTSFKQRHGFRKVDTNEHLETVNENEANKSKAQLKNLLQSGEYTLENVYNADSLGLLWEAVPEKTPLYDQSKQTPNRHGEKVTTFLCANATGSHKLPVIVIATNENPPGLTSFRVLNSIYKANTPPIMDSKLFNEWFDECFLKSVRKRQQRMGRRMKTLLLLDNVYTHHNSGIISTKDELVKIMYLSYDAASLIQPMDNGIITCFKRKYRLELLRTLTPCFKPYVQERAVIDHYELNMWDCCRLASLAWSDVNNPILKNAWDKILKDESEQSSEDPEIIRNDMATALERLKNIPGCSASDSIAVMNWIESNKKHIDVQIDISSALMDFVNAAMDTEVGNPIDENFEDILDDIFP